MLDVTSLFNKFLLAVVLLAAVYSAMQNQADNLCAQVNSEAVDAEGLQLQSSGEIVLDKAFALLDLPSCDTK